MNDLTGTLFEIPLKSEWFLPIIVEEVGCFTQTIRVSDAGRKLVVGDVLVSSVYCKAGHSIKLYVTEAMCIEDLFEDFVLLDVLPVSNTGIPHISDILNVGDELKLFASSHEET